MGNEVLGFGIDESNHGRYPEFFVAVSSQVHSDFVEVPELLPKIRKKASQDFTNTLFSRFHCRKYSYLTVSKEDFSRWHKYEQKGIIISSLLYPLPKISVLELYLDGELRSDILKNTRSLVSDFLNIRGKCTINIFTGKDLDRRVSIVNLADQLAHYFYKVYNKCRNLDSLSARYGEHEKDLLK